MAQRGRKSRAQLDVVGNEPAILRPKPAENEGPPPPEHLGAPERELWRSVFRDFELASGAAIAVLAVGLEAHQRARECRERVAVEGMTTVGRDGQPRVHPLLAVERDARQAFLSAFRAMGLEL
ncbi:MAG: P27 family phage terminase small subunit [Methyloceanibacter sp.]